MTIKPLSDRVVIKMLEAEETTKGCVCFVGSASVQSWSFVVGASCTDFVRPLVCILA